MAKKKEKPLGLKILEEEFNRSAKEEIGWRQRIKALEEILSILEPKRHSLISSPPSKELLSTRAKLKSAKTSLQIIKKQKQEAFEKLKAQRKSTLAHRVLRKLSREKQRAVLKKIARMKKRKQKLGELMNKERSIKKALKKTKRGLPRKRLH